MKIKGKNVLESYLTLLDVRYTKSFTDQYFNEHPHKFSLYGISKMLFDYGIDNGATQIPDKEQNMFKQKDCNNILESKAARLFGTISLSEIGFGYFATNLLLLLLYPASLPAIALLNILTLPFTLWSVWYQGAKAKQWCALCLIVLALLWAIFFINLLFGYIDITRFFFFGAEKTEGIYFQLFVAACCYLFSVLGVNLIASKVNNEKETQSLRQSINSLKADEDVFKTLLKKQPYFETSDCDSVFRFGNRNSKLRIFQLFN